MAITNLDQYYKSLGQTLPSLATRGQLYESAGLGKATDYVAQNKAGSIAPNTAYLNYLQNKPASTNPVANIGTQSTTTLTSNKDEAIKLTSSC